ncbi:MAG: amidohydrolase family protein [Gemmataceae bacterium]
MPFSTRRGFLEQGLAAVSAAVLPSSLYAETPMEPPPLRVIDTHQHLWDRKQFKLPWIEKGSPLDRDFLMGDYFKATEGLNVVKTIYMEVDLDPSQQQAEADYVIALCQKPDNPMVAAVISGRPASEAFAKYIKPFKNNHYVKGVRQVLHNDAAPAGTCLGDQFKKSIQLLGQLGMSFDLCMRPTELLDAAKLIDACPDTRFILDHCGNARVPDKDRTQWKRDLEAVAKHKRVVCKVSGIVASAKPGQWKVEDLAPIVNHVLDTFGPDRVMFGGDWPVCTLAASYKEWFDALTTIVKDRSRAAQEKLFHDNAVRVYGLKAD